MAANLTISVSDEALERIKGEAAKTSQTPEEFIAKLAEKYKPPLPEREVTAEDFEAWSSETIQQKEG